MFWRLLVWFDLLTTRVSKSLDLIPFLGITATNCHSWSYSFFHRLIGPIIRPFIRKIICIRPYWSRFWLVLLAIYLKAQFLGWDFTFGFWVSKRTRGIENSIFRLLMNPFELRSYQRLVYKRKELDATCLLSIAPSVTANIRIIRKG